MGTAGHPRSEFQTALRTGSFKLAMEAAHSLPHISLTGALRLTLLAARADPDLYPEMARRWLARVIVECGPSLDELAWAAALARAARRRRSRTAGEIFVRRFGASASCAWPSLWRPDSLRAAA